MAKVQEVQRFAIAAPHSSSLARREVAARGRDRSQTRITVRARGRRAGAGAAGSEPPHPQGSAPYGDGGRGRLAGPTDHRVSTAPAHSVLVPPHLTTRFHRPRPRAAIGDRPAPTPPTPPTPSNAWRSSCDCRSVPPRPADGGRGARPAPRRRRKGDSRVGEGVRRPLRRPGPARHLPVEAGTRRQHRRSPPPDSPGRRAGRPPRPGAIPASPVSWRHGVMADRDGRRRPPS